MRPACARTPAIATAAVVLVLAAAGCGSSGGENTAADNADIENQVNEVCAQVANEIKGLPDPTDKAAAVKAQRQSAQILQTASGKLRELATDTELPTSYATWLDSYEQLAPLNEKAAEAFSADGLTSDQAVAAGEKWAAQAQKANALARTAGLDGCVLGDGQAG